MVELPRDITTEPIFPTDEIQGDILSGLVKKSEKFIFFSIGGPRRKSVPRSRVAGDHEHAGVP